MRERGLTTREISRALKRPYASTGGRIHHLIVQGEMRPLRRDERLRNRARIRAQRTQSERERAARVMTTCGSTRAPGAGRDAAGRVLALSNSRHLGYVIGVLYGDAYVHRSRMSIALRCRGASFADAFVEAARQALTLNVKRLQRIEPIKKVGGRVYYDLEYHEAWIHDRHLVQALLAWTGPTTTREWAIPLSDAKTRGPDYCDGVIQGLFDSDGSFGPSGNGITIRFGTASAQGASSLHALMVWRGYEVTLAPINSKGEHRLWVRAASSIRYAREISSRIQYKRARLEDFLVRVARRDIR